MKTRSYEGLPARRVGRASRRCRTGSGAAHAAPSSYGWHVLMRAARARLMFSSEARAFLRSGDPRLVRTSPSDTARNSSRWRYYPTASRIIRKVNKYKVISRYGRLANLVCWRKRYVVPLRRLFLLVLVPIASFMVYAVIRRHHNYCAHNDPLCRRNRPCIACYREFYWISPGPAARGPSARSATKGNTPATPKNACPPWSRSVPGKAWANWGIFIRRCVAASLRLTQPQYVCKNYDQTI